MTVLYLVKDYIEVVHKLIETSPSHVLQHSTYNDSLTIINFGLSTLKQLCSNFFNFEWLKQLWYFPIVVPEIATSMMEEISVLDGNFHNILSFLDKPIAVGNEIYGDYYLPLTCFEKIFTGLINSLFIWIPTSTATFLCFRRFIMQGVEAGYAAALGTMAATIFWLASILFGLRFIVVPWMSLDLVRYWLGFLLLMKYFWDNRYAYKEVKHNSVFGKKTKRNIFGFHFLLALTEQTSLYPFLSNFSISSQSTLLEGFPSENVLDFSLIHFSYLLGIGIGSYSLINLICWFWQDPAYRFYFWIMNKFKKLRIADIVRPVHLFFQSITVLFAFSSLPYFGIEYQITNPLGFLPNDQAFHQFKQTSFLTHPTSPAYYRSRLNFPRQKFFRYEDWAEYYHRNTPLDTSLYDQGAYRLYTMEDLSYGKDYEWMRRRSDKIKIRSRLKRLRWFPRNWANRLWEFTKTWSRRNVLWRNDILNMYQYSWDSKAPLIWNKLVFEEFFPTTFGQQKSFSQKTDLLENKFVPGFKSGNEFPIATNWDSFWGPDPDWTSKFLWNQNSLNNKDKQLWFNWQSRLNLTDNDTWWKWLITNGLKSNPDFSFQNNNASAGINSSASNLDQSRQRLQNSKFSNKTQKGDFWEPQNRLISLYSENSQKKELVLESSTLRKFVRKLSARFKLAEIDKVSLNNGLWYSNPFSSNSFKTLLLTPSFRDWTVFQTVMTNMNRILWWRRLTKISNEKKSLFTPFPNEFSGKRSYQLAPSAKIKLKTLNKTRSLSSSNVESVDGTLRTAKNFLSIPVLTNVKRFVKTKKLSYSENKFAKIQNKYFEIKMKQNVLKNIDLSTTNNLSSRVFPSKHIDQLSQLENYKKIEINTLKVSKPTLFLNKRNTNKFFLFKNKNKININNWSPINSVNVSLTLLHPLQYYLHKEQNFKRKLSFYGVKNTILSKPIQKDFSSLNANGTENKSFMKADVLKRTPREMFSTDLSSSTEKTVNILQSYPEALENQNKDWNSASAKKNSYKGEKQFIQGSSGGSKAIYSSSLSDQSTKLFPITKNKNKLPIFNFYLKTYFQTYKKTKLYVLNTKMKRQLGMGASARRKGRDYSNKLLKRSKILSNTPWIRQWIDQSGFLARRKRLETWIARQHYDPNELWSKIMKVDVDLFMNRQPSNYFLTNTEEKLLHLRRFLLFEHYDSLRWYTYMTNYRTMKNTIGGTKSFTNRIYNQQFKGTFHKVRHLFSLTPSSSNGSLLKFDRPLYNFERSAPKESALQAHEELQNLTPPDKEWDKEKAKLSLSNNFAFSFNSVKWENINEKKPMDFIEKSTQILQQSIWENNFIRKNYISFLLEQKNYNLLTKFLVSNTLDTPESIEIKNSNASSKDEDSSPNKILKNKHRNLRTSASIKTNLQTKLMISIFRKRQKWTRDYKRASEKLWKKWKLRSKLISNKTLYLLSNNKNNSYFSQGNFSQEKIAHQEKPAPQLVKRKSEERQMGKSQSEERQSFALAFSHLSFFALAFSHFPVKSFSHSSSNYSGKNLSILNKKFSQIIKLKKLTAESKAIYSQTTKHTPFGDQATVNSKAVFYSPLLNEGVLPHLNLFKYNSVIRKALKEAVKIQSEQSQNTPLVDNRTLWNEKIFTNNNIFTKKMIKDMYNKSVQQNALRQELPIFSHSKKGAKSLWINSFLDYKLQNILHNRFSNQVNYNFGRNLNEVKIDLNALEKTDSFSSQNQMGKSRALSGTSFNTELSKHKNLQLYQKNLIRRERSNIQNFVFMKKFLLNDYNSPLTRSQIRPLPGKRTKALYEKSRSSGTYNANLIRKNNPFLSSINDIDLKILAYKNRKWVELIKTDNNLFPEKIGYEKSSSKPSMTPLNGKWEKEKDFSVSKLNNKWKLFLSKIKKSPKLVSGQMDQTLQTKLIKDQNLMFLTNAITDNISTKDLKKEFKTINTTDFFPFLMNEKSAGTVLEDSSVLKNVARQKLTKTILSKQKIINSLEKPNIIRITKSLRKRQQDNIVRSLLKRHLNFKSRRKLSVKTKEINNQRMSLDRKYEIDERLFLNQISYFAELKQLLGLRKSRENIFKEGFTKEFKLANKNLLKINSFNASREKNVDLMKYKSSPLINYDSKTDSKFSFNSEIRNLVESQKLKSFNLNQQNVHLLESAKFTNSKNLVENFISWLSLFNLKNLDNFSTIKREKQSEQKERAKAPAITGFFSSTTQRSKKNLIKNLNASHEKVKFSITKNFQNKEKLSGNLTIYRDKQSYLSSIKRSSLFITKILKNNQTQNNDSYLSFKLNQRVVDVSVVENEKNILRRSLRKFSVANSMSPFLFEKVRRGGEDQLYKSTRKFKSLTTVTKRTLRDSFVNNFLLKNWIRLKNSQPVISDYNTNQFEQTISSTPINMVKSQSKALSLVTLPSGSKVFPSKKELINLNKYIIFARTNQNKLSRQQIRKKLKKRRIIRSKRTERLKTLKDHPLKFRSEQIQTFYNIRDSLKKWKNFSFISSKVKYNIDLPHKGTANMRKSPLLRGLFFALPLPGRNYEMAGVRPQNNFQNENFNKNLEFQTLNYKPLLNKNEETLNYMTASEKNVNKEGSFLPFLETTLSPFYTNGYLSFSDSFENNKLSNSDLFYTLYRDIFLNSPSFNDIGNRVTVPSEHGKKSPFEEAFLHSAPFAALSEAEREEGDFEPNKLEKDLIKPNWPALNSKLLVNNTNMPFYAGWDNSVRKFVLTNRLLTRREAGYEISNLFYGNESRNKIQKENGSKNSDSKGADMPVTSQLLPNSSMSREIDTKNLTDTNNIVFSSWPLKGKNAATTLFSQFPFMTAPETNLNNSDKQIRSVKAGTKYVTQGLRSSTTFTNERKKDTLYFYTKWKQKNTNNITKEKKNINQIKSKSDNSNFSPNINFDTNKRIKTIIKSSKNEDQIGIRQSGQVISNLATPTSRKTARRALFSSRPWRDKRQTTKPILFSSFSSAAQKKKLVQKDNQSRLNFRTLRDPKLFMSLNSKKDLIDSKLSSKLLFLRNLRHGNQSQTKLAYLRRLQNFIRPTGSAWKTTLNLSRRKKQRIKQSNFFSSRFSVRKRKKRGNNKNPRLRGDKNYKKTKRQYRQKLYLRPKNKPLRRRSLGVAFQNKLNYWRRQYQNLSNTWEKSPLLSQRTRKQTWENDLSTKSYSLNGGKILFSKNLQENLSYSQKTNEWVPSYRPRKLYRSLFKNSSRQTPILYSTLPGHSRSIPIIKNLPLPGSSVKTLNRIIKWSSADGASRFYRVNLSYGWAMELFLQNLQQKIQSKNNNSRFRLTSPDGKWEKEKAKLFLSSLSAELRGKGANSFAAPLNTLIKKYLSQLVDTNKNKFSSSRVFKRRFYKLRQLSYTMSLRLYDRWFFYYYKTGNSGEQSNENFDGEQKKDWGKNVRNNDDKKTKQSFVFPLSKLSTFYQNRFNEQIKQAVVGVPPLSNLETDLSQFKHVKKFLTFHLNENQSNFRSYLKNLRATSYLKTQTITTNELSPEVSNSALTDNFNSSLLGETRTKNIDGLESFKLLSTDLQQPGLEKSNLAKSGQLFEDKMTMAKSNKTLLKKEKKYAEDRFFFAQFNKPPLVDDSRLTFENNRHFPLNGGFVWPGDYLRLKTILLPKEMKDLYLLEKNKREKVLRSGARLSFTQSKQMMEDKKKERFAEMVKN
uniref:Hypothetical chloroplast RF1 n=1 Tax=Chaetophora lobata TaxID=1249516 RepID=A0A7U1APZ7_9CHLO|nr:hypothetical chloroplast RF1 [Chaetophora lobata]